MYSNAIPDTLTGSGTGDANLRQDYKENGTGGASHTFTGTIGAAYFITISVSEISGAATSGALDKTATGSDFTHPTHTTSSTATTAQANELIVGYGGSIDTDTFTIGGSYTERTNIAAVDLTTNGLVAGTRVVAATSTYAFDFTNNSGNDLRTASGISTWKEAAASSTRQRCIGCGVDKKVIGQ